MKYFLLLCLISTVSTFLFPGGGGGGCGCGGGGGGCGGGCGLPSLPMPSLGCSQMCFSVPTLKLPSPCGGGCGGGCGRKKRETVGDEKCTVPEMTDIIIKSLRNNPKESRDNILAEVKEKFADNRYLVTCVDGQTDFKTSASNFCSAGTAEQTCFIIEAVDKN